MVIENLLPPFYQWLPQALVIWLGVLIVVGLVGLFFSWLMLAVERRPDEAFRRIRAVVAQAVRDFVVLISWGRIRGIAFLAVKECIRRRVVAVFLVFLILLMFAGWQIDPSNREPAVLYLNFVLSTTTYLMLLFALFLSSFSLPSDIRNRTIHTVVTKPVRASEILLGRWLGFATVGTVILVAMAVVSYFFVTLGLNHRHFIKPESLVPIAEGEAGRGTLTGLTTNNFGHRHRVYVDVGGQGRIEVNQGHYHSLRIIGSGQDVQYEVGPPQGFLLARVPVYGKLEFRDRDGLDADKGLNVGDEWTYRGYIQGASPSALIWTFDRLSPSRFPDGLPLEITLGVFRTHKGNIEKPVLGSIAVRNPKTGLFVETEIFESKEFAEAADIKRLFVPRKIVNPPSVQIIQRKRNTPEGIVLSPPNEAVNPALTQKREFDLYEDLCDNGRLEIWIRCLEPGQYFGAAQPDLYIRARDASFVLNLLKGCYGIWLVMVILLAYGLTASTFLSAPVAMVVTIGVLVGGLFRDFMIQLALGQTYGGGPFESLYRLVTQENVMSELEPGLGTTLLKMADVLARGFLFAAAAVLPPLGQFGWSDWVAHGFDIPWEHVLIRTLQTFAFVFPVLVAGYFFFKSREIAE
jgi:hypothetical protein